MAPATPNLPWLEGERVRLLVGCLAWTERIGRSCFVPDSCRFLVPSDPLFFAGVGPKPGTVIVRDAGRVYYVVPQNFLREPA